MKRLLVALSLLLPAAALSAGLFTMQRPGDAEAAGTYPFPNFTQVGAGELVGGNTLAPFKCNLDGDGVTCHLVVDAGTGFTAGGGSTTFPYSYTASQTATAASFLGIGGVNGSTFNPLAVSASGVASVNVTNTVPVTGTFYQATQPVSGSLSVSNTVPVTGTFFQATQPVSIAATVPVSGTFFQTTQPVSCTTTNCTVQLGNGANVASVDTNGVQRHTVCDAATSTNCAVINSSGDNQAAKLSIWADSVSYAWNGSASDRIRKDSYAAGPLWTTTGGGTTVAVASAATSNAIKSGVGRLAKLLVTVTGTGAFTCYDGLTATGTVVGVIAASAPAGTVVDLQMPLATGLSCVSAASGPAVTVSYW